LDAAAKNCVLMPRAEELTKGNAASFYKKAVEALPPDLDMYPVWGWLKLAVGELPRDEVQAVLEQAKTTLDLLHRGARCKDCDWPRFKSGTFPPRSTEYRHLACLLSIKARLEISQEQYEKALDTLRTGLAASKHIGEAPSIIQGLVGIAMVPLMLQPIDDLAQAKDAPNLYTAIHSLPRPFIDIEVSISADDPPWLVRVKMKRELEDSYEKSRALMRRLDANLAALECIEALRHFAAGHDGRLPTQLSEIMDLQIPNDPATGQPFAYRVERSKAVLETSSPKNGAPHHSARYEVTVAH
jgi:tetratricopeptide (TPR) repeat protein